MLLELRLPTFDTLLWNSRVRLHNELQACNNTTVLLLLCDFTFDDMTVRSYTMFHVLCFMVH